MAYIFAQEVKDLLNADFVAIIEYSFSKTQIINSVPIKTVDKDFALPKELYLILRSLEQDYLTHIDNSDIKSEHFKKVFPLFNYKHYHILPIFSDNSKIITLEIYSDLELNFFMQKKTLNQLMLIFRKNFVQQNNFQKEIAKIKKNELIIKFLDRIRNTLDKNELEQIILEEICQAFQADRAYFITSYKDNPQNPKLGKEYLANPYVISLRGNNLDFEAVWEQMEQNKMTPPVFVIEDSEKFVKQNNIEGSAIDIFIQKSQIKSSYPFFIYEDEISFLYIVLQYTKEATVFEKLDFEVAELITKQVRNALTQANLQAELMQNNKKEKLLMDSISILRSSLDLKKVSTDFVSKVGIFFNADRCSIRFYDSKTKEFLGFDEAFEYKKHYYTRSTKNTDLQAELGEFLMQNEKFHDTFAIQYDTDLNNNDFEFKNELKAYADKNNIKSYLASFIRYNNKLLGLISLHFQNSTPITEHNELLIKVLADQVGIAIYQSELYTNIQNIAKKEKLLKEVYADTISLQNKEQIYNYFSEKIMNIFNSVGCVFIDFPTNSLEKTEYYENFKISHINISKFKNYKFFNEIINKKMLLYNCKLKNENEEAEMFLNDTGLTCIMTIPINEQSLLVLFFNNKKEFSAHDKNIMFSLVEAISKSIKDSLKTAEIKNLKENFLSTLSHDLQIPLVAERNAINYLINKNEICQDENAKEILTQLKETNSQTEEMLRVLTTIYKYETHKQLLNKEECNIIDIMDESISKMSKTFENKKLSVKREINTENLHFFGDYDEIVKVLMVILLNLADNSPENGTITFELSDNNIYLKCCISGEGQRYSEDLSNKVFPRNILTNTLEHRIGEGIYLHLAKLIIAEHNGKIYINNKQGKGNVFCIELEKII